MTPDTQITQLLRWRLEQFEAEAPPAPRAARLLALVRPWWETWPEMFQAMVARLGRMQTTYGHAMTEAPRSHSGHPVPVLIVQSVEEMESSVRVLYFQVRARELRLRIQLEPSIPVAASAFEVTFVSEATAQPLFVTTAERSVDTEYRIDADLPDALVPVWQGIKVTDRMPFRLILRGGTDRA